MTLNLRVDTVVLPASRNLQVSLIGVVPHVILFERSFGKLRGLELEPKNGFKCFLSFCFDNDSPENSASWLQHAAVLFIFYKD